MPDLTENKAAGKICAVLCAAVFFALNLCGAASALPDKIGDWSSEREDETRFVLDADDKTPAEDVGLWIHRVYTKENPRRVVEVNLMEGSGPGPLRVPEVSGADGERVLNSESEGQEVQVSASAQAGTSSERRGAVLTPTEYRVIEVAGHRAILERHGNGAAADLLPLSLAMPFGTNGTLTLEGHVDEDELTGLAEKILTNLENSEKR